MLHPRAKFINNEDYRALCDACHSTESENVAEIFSRLGLSAFLEKHPALSWATVTVVLTGGVLFFESQAEYNDWFLCQEFPIPQPSVQPMGFVTVEGNCRWGQAARGAL